MNFTKHFALTSITVISLAGCGQVGPLYIPESASVKEATDKQDVKPDDGATTTPKPKQTGQKN